MIELVIAVLSAAGCVYLTSATAKLRGGPACRSFASGLTETGLIAPAPASDRAVRPDIERVAPVTRSLLVASACRAGAAAVRGTTCRSASTRGRWAASRPSESSAS